MEINFNASLDDFQALMLYLQSQHGGTEWTLPSGARLVIEERPPSNPTIQISWVVSIPIDVDASNRRHATIQAFRRGQESAQVLLEDSRTISSNKFSLGKIQPLDPDRAIGSPLFDELRHELQHQMDKWAPPPIQGDAHKRRGGRPGNADDDWAHQEIKSGRDPTQVYKEWLERIPKSRRTQLANPLDSFKKAMSHREKKEKRE